MASSLNTIVLDLGTTAIKAAVFNNACQMTQIFSQPAPEISINKGHYVSDALAYLNTVDHLLKKCRYFTEPSPGLGLCYQRSSFLIWNSKSGIPVTPLISWQDNRGQASCDKFQAQNPFIRQLTGLPLSAYYLAPKLHTLFIQQPELLSGIVKKKLSLGTLDSFIIWHWTAGKHFRTDASMAARTLLMDIHKGQWSERLCTLFNIPYTLLPEIHSSCTLNLTLNNGAVLQASVADQSAALLSSVENDGSEVLVNLGTGGFVVRYMPEQSNCNDNNYLNTLVYQDSQQRRHMAVEGTLNSITAALQPYPFRSSKIKHLAEINDIYCISEPNGIGAPFFRSDISLQFSQSIDHLSKQQIAALLLEGIIFRVALILEDFNQQAAIQRVYLSGGLSSLPCLQQGIALLSPASTLKIMQKQSGLLGVAILSNKQTSASHRQSEYIQPNSEYHALVEKYQGWKSWFNQLIAS